MHLADASLVERYADEVPPAARKLAAAFWPGPMTLVLRRSERVSDLVTGGLETVGIRVPCHPVAQALLQEFGGPIAAPSANRFGRVSCTRAQHVADELGDRVDLILDGGECSIGLESTIIDVSSSEPSILRPGGVTAEQITAVLGGRLAAQKADAPRVSGSLPSHYAPRARVEVVADENIALRAKELAAQVKKVALLTRDSPPIAAANIVILTAPSDAVEFGHELYSLLRRADELGCDVILTALPADQGLGAAIADRLRRAAGPQEG